MTMTDIFVLIALAAMAINGAMGGFVHSLLGPISFIVSILIGGLVYLISRNFTAALLVASIAPFIVGWALKKAVRHFLNRNTPQKPSPISRIGGLAVNLVLGGLMIAIFVGALSLIPLGSYGLGDINTDITESKTTQLIEPFVLMRQGRDADGNPCPTNLCNMKAEDAQALNADPIIQEIAKDPRFQKILNSPEIQSAIQRGDYAVLLRDPAVIELQKDPSFIVKAFRAYATIRAKESK
ncbi:MAG: CvpA family protein [Candidatus Omnitrophica bacterium]|nr:CvpA family protein [Candidatus Omnitrophota bacterium]